MKHTFDGSKLISTYKKKKCAVFVFWIWVAPPRMIVSVCIYLSVHFIISTGIVRIRFGGHVCVGLSGLGSVGMSTGDCLDCVN